MSGSAEPLVRPAPPRDPRAVRRKALEWVPILAGPLALAINLQVSYMLVGAACAASSRLVLASVHLVSLLIVLGGAMLGWRHWVAVDRGWPGEEPGDRPRKRFLAVVGLLSSALFTMIVLAQAVPTIVLNPCQ